MFVTFEGIDGSGKTTQAKILYDFLKSKNHNVILTHEPGGGAEFSMKIRQLLSEYNIDIISEMFAVFAARNEHIQNVIKPSLELGKIVICDRFIDSSIVYCIYKQKNQEIVNKLKALIENMQNIICGNIRPSQTFLLNTSFKNVQNRLKNKKNRDRYDEIDIHKYDKIMANYLLIAKNEPRISVINGNESIQNVSNSILDVLKLNI